MRDHFPANFAVFIVAVLAIVGGLASLGVGVFEMHRDPAARTVSVVAGMGAFAYGITLVRLWGAMVDAQQDRESAARGGEGRTRAAVARLDAQRPRGGGS